MLFKLDPLSYSYVVVVKASMDVNQVLEYAYGWNRYIMMFLGTWPENRSLSQASSYKVMIPVLMMLFFVTLPQSTNLLFIWGDFDLVVENLAMANITITISMLKTIMFWSKAVKSLMESMARDWRMNVDERNRSTMLDIAKMSRKLSIMSTLLVVVVVLCYFVLRWFMIRYGDYHLLFPSSFPYNTTNSPFYELTLLGQVLGCIYAATSYTAVDTFIATLVLHACGQLSNLRRELTDLQAVTKTEFQTKLRNIVRKHVYLNRNATMFIIIFFIRFTEIIEDCFNMMLLLQMLGCSLQLCVQCFQTLMSVIGEVKDDFLYFQIIFLVLYVVYILLQLYLYCYIGEKLLIESTQIASAAYECSWYNLKAYQARSLIGIIRRARSPLHISAGGFCCFNRELFSEILKRSVAYMSFLYAMRGL